jgi:3-hydroxyisobutyrate dehydrogenase-like beta-hydroxyacid dehydrogenase
MNTSKHTTEEGNKMDELTTKIAKELIEKFDAAVSAGDFAAMQDVVNAVIASPNKPFKKEVLRQIGG